MPRQNRSSDGLNSTRDAVEAISSAFADVFRAGLAGMSKAMDAPRRSTDTRDEFRQRSNMRFDDDASWRAQDSWKADAWRGAPADSGDDRDGDRSSLLTLPIHAVLNLVTETSRAVSDILGRRNPPTDRKAPPQGRYYDPPYVDAASRPYPPQPYVLRRCNIQAFWAEGDLGKLQAICDEKFSRPTGDQVRYRVLTSKLVIFLANIDSVVSSIQGSDSASASEVDLAIWAVAIRERPFVPRLVFAPLHMFVDHGTAQASGREIYGFPKHHVRFDSHLHNGLPHIIVNALVGRTDPALPPTDDWQPILGLKALEEPTRSDMSDTDFFTTLLASFFRSEQANSRFISTVGSFAGLQNLVELSKIRMAFLKQTPSAEDYRRASYQAVVEAAMSIEHLRGLSRNRGQWALEVIDHPQFPFGKPLGLKSGPLHPTISLDVDLTLPNGTVLWRSGSYNY